jgi:endo-1,4-beta-xylanase
MTQLADPQGRTEAEQQLLAGCDDRIRRYRMADLTVTVRSEGDHALPNATVHVRQRRHAFLFGCNVYALGQFAEPALSQAYADRFAALLNYATLPFYWGGYEPEPGQTGEQRLRQMADWCLAHDIATKGHPLVWHEVVPGWLAGQLAGRDQPQANAGVQQLLEARVRGIIAAFAGRIDRWDVINEATVSAGVDNGVGEWVKALGCEEAVRRSLTWAREAGPGATLVVNDFNLWPEAFPDLLTTLNRQEAPYDAIGLQSHMHAGTRPLTDWWDVCERYAPYGKPLHFTEMTVLSGATKTDGDWMGDHPGWDTTPEGEQRQAEYVANLYRVLFSHPAMAAITWWDFSDAAAWQGAPAGLVRQDMSPKPVYERLLRLVKHDWWTDQTLRTDEHGEVHLRAFLGDYAITVSHGGTETTLAETLSAGDANRWAVCVR